MKFKAKIKTVLCNGDKKTFVKSFSSDTYLDEDEQMEFIDDTDLSDWMIEKDILTILDYFIIKEKPYLPVDVIRDDYDGGWIAPNGDLYAMKGDFDDYIHIAIAHKLYKHKLIPQSRKNKFAPENWLSLNGWVKIHFKYIHYCGYHPIMGNPKIPLTPEQIKTIYTHGQVKCGGMLACGDFQKYVSAARFEMTDPLMLYKYFEL